MLALSRNRSVATVRTQGCGCNKLDAHPTDCACDVCMVFRRRGVRTRTRGIEVGGAGLTEWQKTHDAIEKTSAELRAWIKAYAAEAQKRADSGTFSGSCKKGSPLQECLTANEQEAVRWIGLTWNPFVDAWNELKSKAVTGVPWGDDATLRDYQAKLIAYRKRFEDLGAYKFLPIPAWSADRSFSEAVKESTGFQIPSSTTLAIGAGIAIVATVLLTRK